MIKRRLLDLRAKGALDGGGALGAVDLFVVPAEIFSDGFENGNTTMWSSGRLFADGFEFDGAWHVSRAKANEPDAHPR